MIAGMLAMRHRDDGLRRERFQQSDFLVRERPHLPPVGGDEAEQGALLAQRNHQERASAGPDRGTTLQGFCSGPDVGDLDITFATQQPLMEVAAAIRLPMCLIQNWGMP